MTDFVTLSTTATTEHTQSSLLAPRPSRLARCHSIFFLSSFYGKGSAGERKSCTENIFRFGKPEIMVLNVHPFSVLTLTAARATLSRVYFTLAHDFSMVLGGGGEERKRKCCRNSSRLPRASIPNCFFRFASNMQCSDHFLASLAVH